MSAYACDHCARSVHRLKDGYFCCLAPGMWSISATHKRVEPCEFYEYKKRVKTGQLSLFDDMEVD